MRTKISNTAMTVEQAKAHMSSIGERVLTVTHANDGRFSVYSTRAARGTMGDSAVSIESDPRFGTYVYR